LSESPPVRALIFDMDGLLVDSEGLAAAAMDQFLAERGLTRKSDVHPQLLGRRLVEALAIVRSGYQLDEDLDAMIARYGDLRLEALRGSVTAMPGALQIIARARSTGYRIALATSGIRAHVNVSLEETGLTGRFDAEATGDDVTRGKPAPDLFLLAADRLGVAPEEAIVLEDSPLGVEAAANAGMRSIAVLGQPGRVVEFPVAPTVIVDDLHEAADWLGLPALEPDAIATRS
jgi:HAD superfamily hydrolase (TIGR01509 family)